jgi:ABC-type Co2+ transport system permease subunit
MTKKEFEFKMEQMTKETETRKTKQDNNTTQRIIATILGVIGVTLAFRLIFKLLGANPGNGFVSGIYAVTQPFVGIFEGIFSRTAINGAEATGVLEPATLISMVVIAIIAWAVLKLITPLKGNRFESTEYTKHNNQTK